MSYSGSCHCGDVTFTVDAEPPTEAISCNCSHCHRKGFLLTFVPLAQFRIDSGADRVTDYLFNKHMITHQFCSRCGTQAFALGHSPHGDMRAINLRCVPSIDIDALTVEKIDGASL